MISGVEHEAALKTLQQKVARRDRLMEQYRETFECILFRMVVEPMKNDELAERCQDMLRLRK